MSVNNQILGINSKWDNNQYFIPDEYTLPVPGNPIRIYRKNVKRDVDTAMPITPQNPIIRWKVPSNSTVIIDWRRAKVYFTLSVSVTAPWLARPCQLIWNMIDRFRLEQAGQYVEDRRYWSLQETMSYEVQTHINQQATTGVALFGDGSNIERNARAAGWTYCLPIPTTGLVKGIYPWFQISKESAQYKIQPLPDTYLQWELRPPEQWVEVYGAAPGTPIVGLNWNIARVQIEYEEIYADGGNESLLKNWMSKSMRAFINGFPCIYYRTFLTNLYAVSLATEQTILIDFKISSLIAIYVTFRYTNRVSNPEIYSKDSDYISRADMALTQYQWEVNGCLWPDRPVNLTDPAWVEGYAKYLESWQMFHARGIQQEVTPITSQQFLTDKFLCVFDGNQHPFSTMVLNPISTSYSSSQIQLKLTFSAPPPVNVEAVVHLYHWRKWNFGARGQVTTVEV